MPAITPAQQLQRNSLQPRYSAMLMVLLLLGVLLSSPLASAQGRSDGDVLTLKPGHPDTYVVKKGDTLWDISSIFLEDPWLWPEIWHYNQQIDNPHLIYPGDILRLVWIDGKPRLIMGDDIPTPQPKPAPPPSRNVKLQPGMRISDLNEAIPTIPLSEIEAFLNRSRVVPPGTFENSPYILIGREGHLLAGVGDQVYARGNFGESEVFGVYRPDKLYRDPVTRERLGVQAFDIGTVKMLDIERDIATMAINRSTEELRRTDRLLPLEEEALPAYFTPRAPGKDKIGQIIDVEHGVSQIGNLDVVVLNLGDREGMKPGHVLAIHKRGEVVYDSIARRRVKVPDTEAGLCMVFKTFEKVSYALVLKAQLPLSVGDGVMNP